MTANGDVVKPYPLEKEYKKKTGISSADIKQLRSWLQTQPHLPADHITDLDLILAYHCCGRSSEVAKQLLDLNLTLRTLFTSFFKDRFYDNKIKHVMEKVVLLSVLPTYTPEGYSVVYTHYIDTDPKKLVLPDAMRAFTMRMDLWQLEQGTTPGVILLIDFEGTTFGHIAKIELQAVQQYMYYLQEALLVNLKGLHFLNAPPFMDRIMMLIRPFFQKDLMSMLHIHQSGSRTLDKFFPIDQLPKGAVGGNGPMSLEDLRMETLSKMEAGKQYFIDENKKRVVESKRPGRPKTISDIFGGIEGSFKKLDID